MQKEIVFETSENILNKGINIVPVEWEKNGRANID